MKKRNIIITLFLIAILCVTFTAPSLAGNTYNFKSKGNLVYTNDTPETSDDVTIFDVSDLTTIMTKIETAEAAASDGKDSLKDVINQFPGANIDSENPTFDDLINGINNITNIPADTYFFDDATKGSDSIERYKKVGGKYYACNENGAVANSNSEVDVSGKTLVEYTAANCGNLSAGSAAYASKNLLLGDGSDNTAYWNQGYASGYTDGMKNAMDNIEITYTYHEHKGSQEVQGGCYTNPVYHYHSDDCYIPCSGYLVSYESEWDNKDQAIRHWYRCNTCNYYWGSACGDGKAFPCTQKLLVCTKTEKRILIIMI